jgi:hypothetical protein
MEASQSLDTHRTVANDGSGSTKEALQIGNRYRYPSVLHSWYPTWPEFPLVRGQALPLPLPLLLERVPASLAMLFPEIQSYKINSYARVKITN